MAGSKVAMVVGAAWAVEDADSESCVGTTGGLVEPGFGKVGAVGAEGAEEADGACAVLGLELVCFFE